MFVLPILPDELRLPLDKVEVGGSVVCEYPGVTAVVRPLDVESASRWNDAFPGQDHQSMAATQLVFDQLIRIEGLNMAAPGNEPVPFDASSPIHKRSIPMDMRSGIYLGLRTRATLSEEQEKNSASPSDSGGTTSSESSSAEAVASGQETS